MRLVFALDARAAPTVLVHVNLSSSDAILI